MKNKKWRLENGDREHLIEYTKKIFQKNALDPSLRLYVGCDSQNKRYGTYYVTVVVYRYGHRGAHYIYFKEKVVPKIKDRWQRLWGEVERSVQVGQWLEANGYKVFCVDLDLNKKDIARSSDMVKAARGYVVGLGFNSTVKPEDGQIASRAADHLVKQ